MQSAREAIVGLGSNVGSREALLRAAIDLLGATRDVTVLARSPLYDTAPVGPPQPRYLNAAARVRTTLSPDGLLDAALAVERTLGRERRERWGARTIDLDVLWIEGESVATPRLTVPHPSLLQRGFALCPLLALRPDAADPRDGAPLARALDRLTRDATSRERAFEASFVREEVMHTADEGFITRGADRADLLAAAAEAMGAIIVDPGSVGVTRSVPLSVTLDADAGDDERLFAWLSEALYHLDAGRLALRRAVVFDDGPDGVRGALFGETLDESRHAVRSALKAVTWHAMEVGPEPDGTWRAQVIIDV